MFHGRASAFWTLAVVAFLALPADGQSVISTHSGTVHFFEGAVYLGDQPLESHPGRFSSVPQGGELRTAAGRAEVLLTPGVFVRIGEQSKIRMVANKLSDTRVELLAGSAVVDSAEPSSGTSVTLLYKNWSVRFPEQGIYRIDSDPPRLWVFQGKAEVSAGNHEALKVEHGMYVPFAPVLVPERTIDQPRDSLSIWAEGRQQSISADNAIAANIQDPASISTVNPGFDTFTYFPMLGLPSVGPNLSSTYGAYSSLATYQPGFNSIYLPGYTYLPFFVGLRQGGFPIYPISPYRPSRAGPLPLPPLHGPVYHPIGVTPVAPVARPITGHPVGHVGVPAGAHR